MSPLNSIKAPKQPARSTGAVLGLIILLSGASSARSATGDFAITSLTDSLSSISGAGANVVVLETPDGLALVDSGMREQADGLLEFIDEHFDGAPIRVLFNTNWRPEHTGANEAIAQRGATIIAHENTRLWMGTEYYVEWEGKNYTPRPEAALPTATFYSSDPQPLIYELGGYRIEYGHLAEAHTDGDIYVRFAEEDVIAVGDVLAVDAFPLLDYSTGGWIGGAQAATGRLIELAGTATKIVAAEGAPQTRAALEAQLEMLDEFSDRIGSRMNEGKSVDEIFAEGVTEGYESFANPKRFVGHVYHGFWWGGRLRGPI